MVKSVCHCTETALCYFFILFSVNVVLMAAYVPCITITLTEKFIVCCVLIDGSCVEIKTKADSNDITECPHDDKPTTGMFYVWFV